MAEAMTYPLEFASGGAKGEHLEVRQLEGREELSRLYHFDLVLKRQAGKLSRDQIDAMMKAPCALSLGPGGKDVVHGLLERITLTDALEGQPAIYRARVVPKVWLMTQSQNCRIFQETTVAQMVQGLLESYGLEAGKHFTIMIEGGTRHEYVVQYEESDWSFIQRWLEYEGYFYWFEHEASGDRLIIADSNDFATETPAPSTIAYRGRNNLSTGGDSTIWDWTFEQQRIPARVAVVDHNYRTPHVRLVATHDTDANAGFGSAISYGEHFKDLDAGNRIARVRAERVVCTLRTFRGTTDCGRLHVGHRFTLEGHFDDDENGAYLVTAIDHVGGVGTDTLSKHGPHDAMFEAIPMSVPFRPERRTPWPKISGIMHAHVDAAASGVTAEIDANGRYKVRMPYDSSGATGDKASRWIRMAQPYAGSGYGQHFPLHKGTEVLIAHIDGNPDRPIIVGSVPCAHTPSPSTSANATQSVIQTSTGIRIEMEDRA